MLTPRKDVSRRVYLLMMSLILTPLGASVLEPNLNIVIVMRMLRMQETSSVYETACVSYVT